jgi:hypothetical protein
MSRSYSHISIYENEILELKRQGIYRNPKTELSVMK